MLTRMSGCETLFVCDPIRARVCCNDATSRDSVAVGVPWPPSWWDGPGTSALFLMSQGAVTDKVIEAMKGLPPFEIIQANLSQEQEERLRAEFGEE